MDFDLDEQLKTYKKGTLLLHAGAPCKVAYKVISGCLRSYVIDESGKEHILQFAPEGWFISDLDAFTKQKPASLFIDVIETCQVALISRGKYEEMLSLDNPALAGFYQKLINSLIAANKRLSGLLAASSEERYLEFSQSYPGLAQRLPLKLIAAYIGITPEYLSELRRKIAQQ